MWLMTKKKLPSEDYEKLSKRIADLDAENQKLQARIERLEMTMEKLKFRVYKVTRPEEETEEEGKGFNIWSPLKG